MQRTEAQRSWALLAVFGPPLDIPSALRAASTDVQTWLFQPAPDWLPESFCALRTRTIIASSESVQQQRASFFTLSDVFFGGIFRLQLDSKNINIKECGAITRE